MNVITKWIIGKLCRKWREEKNNFPLALPMCSWSSIYYTCLYDVPFHSISHIASFLVNLLCILLPWHVISFSCFVHMKLKPPHSCILSFSLTFYTQTNLYAFQILLISLCMPMFCDASNYFGYFTMLSTNTQHISTKCLACELHLWIKAVRYSGERATHASSKY